MSQVEKLKEFYSSCKDKRPFIWLDGRSYSEAFVICVGAGPWRFERRKKVQGEALKQLDGKDLINWNYPPKLSCFEYPLKWQNDIIFNTVHYLMGNKVKFNDLCLMNNKKFLRNLILEMSGCKTLPKVLSLFCRDSLKIDAFPIDRHVKRKLQELGLPTKEEDMIKICREALLEPNLVATAFVRASSDMDNPDWSVTTRENITKSKRWRA